jgi:hypothetical protein
MSSMLESAIIDAEELRKAAHKNAEEAVVEKYQNDIREAVEKILEQEDFGAEAGLEGGDIGGLEGGDDATLGVSEEGELTFVDDLPAAQTSAENEVVTIDLDKLEEMMAEEMEEGTLEASDMLDREQVAEELSVLATEGDEVELDETVLRELVSMYNRDDDEDEDEDELYTDRKGYKSEYPELPTGLGRPYKRDDKEDDHMREGTKEGEKVTTGDTKGEEAYEFPSKGEKSKTDKGEEDYTTKKGMRKKTGKHGKAYMEETDADLEEKKTKKKDKTGGEQSGGGGYYDYGWRKMELEEVRLNKKVQLLEEKLNKFGSIINKLKEKLNESNLTNDKLLYQNRVLNSISLNERQKDKVAEAISNTTSVEEAKIVFETLQSAVGSVSKRKTPESLNEVVTRSSSAFMPRKEDTQKVDPFVERMRTLAGLKNN